MWPTLTTAPCSSPRTRRSAPGAACCTILISPRPSSTGCLNGVATLELRGPSYRTRLVKLDLYHDLRPLSERPARISALNPPLDYSCREA
jgi:hypothetical protein